MRARRSPIRIAAATALLFAACGNDAGAGHLADLIRDLYGGDQKITLLSNGGPLHAAVFDAPDLGKLSDVTRAIGGIAPNLPLDASSASFTYETDPETGAIKRVENEGLGPYTIFRANTIGARRFSAAFLFTHIDFKYLNGQRLNDLEFHASFEKVPGDNSAFEGDFIDLHVSINEASEDIFGLYLTYGLLETLDLTVVVPVQYVRLSVDADARLVDQGRGVHSFDPTPGRIVFPNTTPTDAPSSRGSGSALGIGDVLVVAKWRPVEEMLGSDNAVSKLVDFAVVPELKLPTGNEDELTGSGSSDFRLFGVFSKTFDGWFEPEINVGYKWSFKEGGTDVWLYGAGVAIKAIDELTVFGGLNGRYEERRLEKRATDIVDGVAGFKVNPWRNLVLGANFIVPLTRQGLEPDVIYSVGLEYEW